MNDGAAPLPPLSRIPAQIASVADYEEFARARVAPAAWVYLNGGAGDEHTLQDNLAAFRRLKLRNRVLADVAGGDTRVSLFDDDFAHPILLAPVAHQKLAHPEGELATVLGASAMRAGMVVSTEANVALEDIARAAQAPLWFQLYFQHDRGFTRELVLRAQQAGYRALVLTVDAPVNGVRNREHRAGFALPAGIVAENLRGLQALPPQIAQAGASLFDSPLLARLPTWKDLDWLRAQTTLPIVLKGITASEDAERALAAGVSGIVVSNHGGRILDTQVASIDALPRIADTVHGRVPLLLDGGIRRGTDILKALAMGASAVLVGRPYVHALATAGAPGVAHVLHILRTELEMAMVATGCRTLADIDRSVLWTDAPSR